MEHHFGQGTTPASESFDKTRVLNVKPLRTLVPVFPSPSNPASSSTPQGGAPFVCVSPSGPFPSGVAPFYPFFISSESQRLSEQNAQTPSGQRVPAAPVSTAVPINSFRTPTGAANGDVGSSQKNTRSRGWVTEEDGYSNVEIEEIDADEGTGTGRSKRKSNKKTKARQSGGSVSVDVDPDAVAADILKSLNALVFDVLSQPEGSRDSVAYTLMIYEVMRRKLGQIEDSNRAANSGAKRPDLKAGAIMMNKGIRTNSKKRIGVVPGVEIGDIFFFRFELCLVGLHAPSMAGIDYIGKTSQEEEPLAVSIVSSGGYEDNVEDGDVLIYSGQGGVNRDKGASDQKLERGNLALEKSAHRGNEVRVIRGLRDPQHPTGKIYVYDGLYKIQNSWVEKAKSGFNVFKYNLVRLPGQPQAYMIWKSIQQWTEKSASRAGVILPDLTSGAENIPVCLVNDVDNEKGPAYFTYIPTLKNLRPTAPVESSTGCPCGGGYDYIFDSTRIYQQLEVFPGDTEAPKIPSPLYISAKNEGNVARFMNHCCSPNVLWRPVIRENKNESDLHIAFYAIRHIPPMMELTYDYGAVLPLKVGQRKKKCLCGSVKCRGYFC
uniref:Histone-lysine N-methyltransferase, H3 lysine-9 specific SUVH1 n=1 Tax=Glycine max TaxID=3847 RepID=A0A368UGG2_SOYBN